MVVAVRLGGGGAAVRMLETHGCQGIGRAGYVRAGWAVTSVDIARRHAKYHPGELVLADAAEFVREHGASYDAVHTSPPCQWYTRGNAPRRDTATRWERTIPPMREALASTGRPYVIENVRDAVWDLVAPVLLCGCMFGLTALDDDGVRVHLERPRLFELGGWDVPGLVTQTITVRGERYEVRSPRACDHSAHEWTAGVYGGARRDKYEARYVRRGGYVPPSKAVCMTLLGITDEDRAGRPTPTWEGLFECVPPAYTQWVGDRLAEEVHGDALRSA